MRREEIIPTERKMNWWLNERRGPTWKQSWAERNMASMSAPPLPLLAIFAIILILLYLSSSANFNSELRHTRVSVSWYMLFLPVVLIMIAKVLSRLGRFELIRPRTKHVLSNQAKELPWGVVAVVLLLLVMVSYQSSLRSMWSPLVWRPN